MKRIKLMRSRVVEYAIGKRNGDLTVFVMVFDICCGKVSLWRNFVNSGGCTETGILF
jgi:hypothetical protein